MKQSVSQSVSHRAVTTRADRTWAPGPSGPGRGAFPFSAPGRLTLLLTLFGSQALPLGSVSVPRAVGVKVSGGLLKQYAASCVCVFLEETVWPVHQVLRGARDPRPRWGLNQQIHDLSVFSPVCLVTP